MDILDALTKNFLGTGDVGSAGGEDGAAGDATALKRCENYSPTTSTLKRQRDIYAAKVVQKAWRKYNWIRKKAGGVGLVDEAVGGNAEEGNLEKESGTESSVAIGDGVGCLDGVSIDDGRIKSRPSVSSVDGSESLNSRISSDPNDDKVYKSVENTSVVDMA